MAKFMLCIDGMEEDGTALLGVPCDGLAAVGTVCTVPTGKTADSLGCILRLLGAAEHEIPQGRAALEALAVGMPLERTDAVLRGTLCAVDADGRLQAPAYGNCAAQFAQLLAGLPQGWALHPLSGYRCLLHVPNGAEALAELTTLPPHQHFGEPAEQCLPKGGVLGELLGAFARRSTQALSGWMLLPWGQSAPSRLTPLQKRMGIHAAMVCHAEIVRGIACALGMACPQVAGATADVDTDLQEKLHAAWTLAQRQDLVCIHVNGCDEAGHRQDSTQKQTFLQKIYKQLLIPLQQSLQAGDCLLLCSDHRTSSASGAHENGAVQFWLYGNGRAAPQEYHFTDAGAPLRLLLGAEGG